MVSDVNVNQAINLNFINYLIGIVFIMGSVAYLLLSTGNFSELSRLYAPPGQALYVYSKVVAIFVYILMWWQIMVSILKKVDTKQHIFLGISILGLTLAHVFLFISAISIRQEEINLGMLLPNFTNDYYKSGLSFGVMALFFIFIATFTGIFRKKIQGFWKVGHSLVYMTFVLATVHGLMIGSDVNSGVLSYIIYGAVFSLTFATIYKKRKHLL